MVRYRILVHDADDNVIGEFERFKNLHFGKKLNNYSQCSFQVPVDDTKAESLIALRRYSCYVYREEGEDSTLIWSGEQAIREGNLDDQGNNWITIICFDWFEQLTHRYTGSNQDYTGVDAGEIAWDLIDVSQDGGGGGDEDLGITEGTIEATQNRDRLYQNHNIAEMIINLSNVINGFDFEINNSKVFNVYAQQGVDRSGEVILEYGVNITKARILENFSVPANRAIILGENPDDYDNPVRVERDDAGQQALYKIREYLSSEMTTSENQTLEDKGDAILRKYKAPLLNVSVDLVRSSKPIVTDFALGDIIRVIIKTGIYQIDDTFRIFEWEVAYDADNTETLNLLIGDFTNG